MVGYVTVSESSSGSISLSNTLPLIYLFSLTDARSLTAVGSSLTAPIVTEMVAMSVPPCPSDISYVRVSVLVKFSWGVYTTPPEAIVAEPSVPLLTSVMVSGSISGSVALSKTSMVIGVSSLVEIVSSIASGASFRPSTVMVTILVSDPP